ncbi:MAG: hypothetical protein ACI9BF_000427 [Candidatus Paceibacteria bacterium]|jgi:hypothetical protein
MDIKSKFPNEDSFRNFLQSNVSFYTNQIQSEVGHLEKTYLKALRDKMLGMILMLAGALIIGGSISILADFLPTLQAIFVALFFGALFIWSGVRKITGTTQIISDFNIKLNQVIFSKIFRIFSLDGSLVKQTQSDPYSTSNLLDLSSPKKIWYKELQILSRRFGNQNRTIEQSEVMSFLDDSELITESRNTIVIDDMFNVDVEGNNMFVSELDARHVTGSGKNRRVRHIFHGYFFMLDLTKQLEGKTFVSAESDKAGFAHLSFFGSDDKVSETIMEWNEFEDKLHVATTNETEARYVLTTNFMSDLYDWWKNKEASIRISFISNKMYAIYPDKKIRIGKTIRKITEKEIGPYLESVGIPMYHALCLVEDVNNSHGQ